MVLVLMKLVLIGRVPMELVLVLLVLMANKIKHFINIFFDQFYLRWYF